MKAQKDFI